MKKLSFLKQQHAVLILRITVGLIFVAHGVKRIQLGTVGGFGHFLGDAGFPLSHALAWIITILEIAGGLALAGGLFIGALGAWFIFHQIMGIILVHWKNGWFVVGPSAGGMEYSVVLIAALITLVGLRLVEAQARSTQNT